MTDVNYSGTTQCDIILYGSIPEFGWKVQGGKANEFTCNSVEKTAIAKKNVIKPSNNSKKAWKSHALKDQAK